MKQSSGKVYADLRAAGFSATQATLMVAIAGAESAWDDTARGDLSLQDGTWGPSFGIYQIRTLKSATGTGSDRDITWLAQSDANQAKAAYDISSGGRDLTPWSTFNTGAYRKFLAQAQSGATDVQPAGLFSGGDVLGGVRTLTVEAVFVVLGLALVGVGLAQVVKPWVKRQNAKLDKARNAAVMLA